MNTVLTTIRDTYLARCGSPDRQKTAWREIIAPAFPPDLAAYPQERPSFLLAETSGDLGCALLWIVQAALVRPFLSLIRQAGFTPDQQTLPASIQNTGCGALAHSEPGKAPVILTSDDNGLRLNGVKKYITAGSQADFILITARAPHEEKVSRLLLLPISAIAPAELKPLDLKGLYTVSHGRLTLEDKIIPVHYRLPLSPKLIRKTLKVNGLAERGLILEAVLACMTYLNRHLGRQMRQPPADEKILTGLSAQQTEYTTAIIHQARTGAQVQPCFVDLNVVNTAIADICRAAGNISPTRDKALIARADDLRFIRSLWP